MTFAETLRRPWYRFFASVTYERDPGFRDVILNLCRKGMLVVSVSGIISILTLVSIYAAVGTPLGWVYDDPGTVVLWDKLLIVFLCIIILGLSRTRFGPRWGRFIVALMIVAASIALLLDDVTNGDISFSVAYWGLAFCSSPLISGNAGRF